MDTLFMPDTKVLIFCAQIYVLFRLHQYIIESKSGYFAIKCAKKAATVFTLLSILKGLYQNDCLTQPLSNFK